MNNLGIEHLYHPMTLAKAKIAHSLMASSYDRRGGNHDWSNYVRTEGAAAVLMEAQGPGCITRIWTADPQKGTVRIFLDGQPEPTIQTPLRDLFARLPLSFGIGGESPENYERSRRERLPMGHTSYCPIPFQHHCKVTIDPEDDYLYYHINYHLFPPGTHVPAFDPTTSLATPEIRRTEALWAAWERGEPLRDWSDAEAQLHNLEVGETAQLLSAEGAGVIHGLRVALPPMSDARTAAHLRENLWLTAHFDDDEPRDPSIRVPLGPLFLDFGQRPAPRSLFAGTDAEGAYYLFFPMPYARSASVRLVNRSLLPIEGIRISVLREPLSELPPDLLRFRATWHVETPFGPDHRDYGGVACRILNLDGRDNYELLNVRAAGHFVGCGFHVDLRDAPTDRAAGEGDEMFFVDDDPRLTLYGTGTEDYVNDAWGIRGYGGPLSGSALDGTWGVDPQFFGYRLHVPDCVPFVRKGRFTLEHGTGNNCSGLYRSVAYWYMAPASNRTRIEEARWEAIRNATP
ncbi:MAG TPA: glycoside hydrolase family 172 protein [Chthonomonadaceae bacterium]|nr:glycoside hydrolase family 172 protein [Chthonomonadaceae bacterium]